MKRCQYVDARTVNWLRNPLRVGNLVYCNPDVATLESLGYFPLVDSARGEYRNGYVQVPHYLSDGNVIVRTWVYEMEQEEA